MTFRHNTDIGQNFLVDFTVAEWMKHRAALNASDRVLEIGPGSGVLSKAILSGECASLDAVEIDTRLKGDLERIAASDARLILHWGDAVTFDYAKLSASPTHVMANLPYHITTPIIWKLLEVFSGIEMRYMLLMTQDEAAARIASGCGTRAANPLSITLASAGTASVVRKVPRSAFYPSPRVDSAIVEIKFRENDMSLDLPRDKIWRRLLAGSFVTRRKTLTNNWGNSFHIPRAVSLEILSAHGLGPLSRPEELVLDDWRTLRGNETLAGYLWSG
jgi:16S rRNA (adenine1518-N6/adenine1519-N6)-dimethyltransferase